MCVLRQLTKRQSEWEGTKVKVHQELIDVQATTAADDDQLVQPVLLVLACLQNLHLRLQQQQQQQQFVGREDAAAFDKGSRRGA